LGPQKQNRPLSRAVPFAAQSGRAGGTCLERALRSGQREAPIRGGCARAYGPDPPPRRPKTARRIGPDAVDYTRHRPSRNPNIRPPTHPGA